MLENSYESNNKDLIILGKKNINKDNFKAKEKLIHMSDKHNPYSKFTSYSKSTQRHDGNSHSTLYSSYSYKTI